MTANCSVPAEDFPTSGTCFAAPWLLIRSFPEANCSPVIRWPTGRKIVNDLSIFSPAAFGWSGRKALAEVGLLDENFFMYGEDMDWCKRFWTHRWQVVFVPSSEAIHYGGASSANSPIRFYIEMQRADLQYWKKHHSSFGVAGYFVLSCLHLFLRAIGYSIAALLRKPMRHIYEFKVKRSVLCLRWLIFSFSRAQEIRLGH